jgi:nucleoside-diphosphate-sugar epimerase
MKYLVTGGAGFIGSHLVEKLIEGDNQVVVVDDLSEGKEANLPNSPKITFYRESILGNIHESFKGIDVVFHLAAKTRPQESIKKPELYNNVNINGTLRVLNNCVANKVERIIFMSSSSVYGTPEKLPIRETDPHLSMSPYALTKSIGEQYCKLFERLYGLESTYIRPFNVFGPRQTPGGGYAAAVPSFIDTLDKGGTPYITGDGEQRRDFVFVDDVVDLMILASESRIYGGAFNAGSGTNVSINELYKIICKLMGNETKPKYVDALFEPRITLADMSLAKELLGWKSKVSLEDGLRRMS